MKTGSMHQLNKRLARERKHSKWLEQNLRNSTQERDSKKAVLRLQTELAYRSKQI